jgi:hypothetical protein
VQIRLEFKPADLWWGLYTERREYHRPGGGGYYWKRHIWICLLPMLPIHVEAGRP